MRMMTRMIPKILMPPLDSNTLHHHYDQDYDDDDDFDEVDDSHNIAGQAGSAKSIFRAYCSSEGQNISDPIINFP